MTTPATNDALEEWKDVPGYEGLYKVSSLGRVFSLRTERMLKPFKHNKGYLHVSLHKDKNGRIHRVHRLVVDAFIGLDPNVPVNHIDKNVQNNALSNLEASNVRENTTHGHDRKFTGTKIDRKCKSRPWRAVIEIDNKGICLGFYKTQEEAHEAYKTALVKYGLTNKYAGTGERI